MLEAAARAAAWFFAGAFSVLILEAWLAQRATSAAITGKGLTMFVQALALTVAALFAAAMLICTWADYAVSGSVRKATGKR